VTDEEHFQQLLARTRAGEEAAAAELVREFEPAIRRAVRLRLRDRRLRRCLDSMDVCQSVLAGFFVRVAAGQFDLKGADDLLKLLAAMVRNKVADLADRHGAARRDFRRVAGELRDADAAGDPTPSRLLAGRELLQEVRRRLTGDERRVLELREQGRDWAAVAAELGATPEALRKRLDRGLDRVAQELGLDEFRPE
jgi:RNA polymerase sigma factor (sigma-70 family)